MLQCMRLGFHGSEDVQGSLKSNDAVWTCRWVPMFQMNIMPLSAVFTLD